MTGELLFRKPSIDVIQGDMLGPMFGKVAAAATVTYLKPGKLVSMLTNDGEIDIAGVADASFNVGIIGYEGTPLAYKPATRDTVYAAGDHVAIYNTPGMRFRGFLINSAAVAPGDLLFHETTDTSGNFEKWAYSLASPAPDGARPLAIALESVAAATTAGTSAVACWMQWRG
jgi:hypothetical protein